MRLLAISGSLRADSHNSRLLRTAAEEAPAGVEIDIYDGLATIPPYDADEDIGLGPAPVRELREHIAAADGLIFATPEYNSSIPGVLKNAIDWASRPRATTPLAGKPTAVMGATTGHFGAVWAQAELRKVLGSTGSRIIDAEVSLALADDAFDSNGALRDETALEGIRNLTSAVVAEVERDRELALAA
jgi:chromate reductase, NAD(P)H dehydrogenase (quinone)